MSRPGAWSLTGHQRLTTVKHQDGGCMLQAGARNVSQCVIHLARGWESEAQPRPRRALGPLLGCLRPGYSHIALP